MVFLYIPQTRSELVDHLSAMFLTAPKFAGDPIYFPDRNIDTEFRSLNEGLLFVKKKLGERRYADLVVMSSQARSLCDEDPGDTNGKAREARALLLKMQEIVGDPRPPKEN